MSGLSHIRTPHVSVVIPTQRRPGGLALAMASIARQTGVDPADVELIVVDNDQTPSARAAVEAFAAPFSVRYVHEPRPGVAFARNAAMGDVAGAFVAFLDDDEEASDGWLAALLAAQARFAADVVFGPVRGRAPDVRHRAYFERFFSREGPAEAGLIAHHYGCGSSLVRRAALPHPTRPFDEARNRIGGEDNRLFEAMRGAGARFAWSPDAWVWEDPAASRLTLRYAIARAFAFGQAPTSDCAHASPPDRLGVARWMAVGLAQTALFGALAAAKWLVRADDRAFALDRAARGLGKAFWWGPFRIAFYGQTT